MAINYDALKRNYIKKKKEEGKDPYAVRKVSTAPPQEKMNPVKYAGLKAGEGASSALSGVESFARTMAANEVKQAAKAKKAADEGFLKGIYQNTLGGAFDKWGSFDWDDSKGVLTNLAKFAGTGVSGLAELATGITGAEGIKNAIMANAIAKEAKKSGNDFSKQAGKIENEITKGNTIADMLNLEEGSRKLAEEKNRQGTVSRFAGDVSGALGGMLPALAVGNPALAKGVMSASAAGSKAQDAISKGASVEDALSAGIASGLTEYGIESLASGIPALSTGKGVVAKAVGKFLPNVANKVDNLDATNLGRAAKWAGGKIGEGLEEVASAAIDPYISRIYDENAENADIQELINNFGIGAAVATILGGAPNIRNKKPAVKTETASTDRIMQDVVNLKKQFGIKGTLSPKQEAILFDLASKNTNSGKEKDIVYGGEPQKLIAEGVPEQTKALVPYNYGDPAMDRVKNASDFANSIGFPGDLSTENIDRISAIEKPQNENNPINLYEKYSSEPSDSTAISIPPKYNAYDVIQEASSLADAMGLDFSSLNDSSKARLYALAESRLRGDERSSAMNMPESGNSSKEREISTVYEWLLDSYGEADQQAKDIISKMARSIVDYEESGIFTDNGGNALSEEQAEAMMDVYTELINIRNKDQASQRPSWENAVRGDVYRDQDGRVWLGSDTPKEQSVSDMFFAQDVGKRQNSRDDVYSAKNLSAESPFDVYRTRDGKILFGTDVIGGKTVRELYEEPMSGLYRLSYPDKDNETGVFYPHRIEYPMDELTPPAENVLPNAEVENAVEKERDALNILLSAAEGKLSPQKKNQKAINFPAPNDTGSIKTRGMAENTIPKAVENETLTEEAAEPAMSGENSTYRPVSMSESQKLAAGYINKAGGVDNAYIDLMTRSEKPLNSTEMAAALEVTKELAKTDPKRAGELVANVSATATDMGRAINLIKTLMQESPQGLLYVGEAQLKKLAKTEGVEISFTDTEKQDLLTLGELAKMDESDPITKAAREKELLKSLSPEIREKVNMVMEKAKKGDEPNWYSALGQYITANKMPPSYLDKWRGWQRIGMMFRPATHERNLLSNAMNAASEIAHDVAATPFDILLSQKTGNRTEGIPSLNDFAKGFKEGFAESVLAHKLGVTGVQGIRNSDGQRVYARLWAGENPLTEKAASVFNWMNDMNTFISDLGDRPFRRGREVMEREKLNRLNGKTEWAEGIAENAGKAATFQEETLAAEMLMKLRGAPGKIIRNHLAQKGMNTDSKLAKIADILSYAATPFAQTPANYLTQVVRYSPSAVFDIAAKTANAIKSENITPEQQRRYVDAIGRGIVGTGLTGLGLILATKGLATGEEDEDRDKASFDRSFGAMPNAVKIGEQYVDLSQIGIPFVAINLGASIYNEMIAAGADEATALSAAENVLSGTADKTKKAARVAKEVITAPIDNVTKDSLWQGITRFVSTWQKEGLPDALYQTALSIIGQSVPVGGFLNSLNGFIDPYMRDTSSETALGRQVNKAIAQLPFLSRTLPIRYDTLGRPIPKTPADSKIGAGMYTMLNPVRTSQDNTENPIYSMISDIYAETGDKDVFPRNAPYNFTKDGVRYDISGDKRGQYQQIQGETAAEFLVNAANSEVFRSLPPEQQGKAISAAIDYGKNKAQDALTGEDRDSSFGNAFSALTEAGIPAPTAMAAIAVSGTPNREENGVTLNGSGNAEVGKNVYAMNIPDGQKKVIAGVIMNKDSVDLFDSAIDAGINPAGVLDLSVELKNAKYSDSVYDDTQKAVAIFNSGLSSKEKGILAGAMGKDIDFTSEETAIITSLSPSYHGRRWEIAKGWNISPMQYARYIKAESKGKKEDKINALVQAFYDDYGEGINPYEWANRFYNLTKTKRYL